MGMPGLTSLTRGKLLGFFQGDILDVFQASPYIVFTFVYSLTTSHLFMSVYSPICTSRGAPSQKSTRTRQTLRVTQKSSTFNHNLTNLNDPEVLRAFPDAMLRVFAMSGAELVGFSNSDQGMRFRGAVSWEVCYSVIAIMYYH